MEYLDDEEIDRLIEFLSMAGINKFCDRDENYREFKDDTFRYIDMLRAYDGCPTSAAEQYKKARSIALAQYEQIHIGVAEARIDDPEILAGVETAAFKLYCDTMREHFFERFIQYRQELMQRSQEHTNVVNQALYRGYLNARDVASYVEYHPRAFS